MRRKREVGEDRYTDEVECGIRFAERLPGFMLDVMNTSYVSIECISRCAYTSREENVLLYDTKVEIVYNKHLLICKTQKKRCADIMRDTLPYIKTIATSAKQVDTSVSRAINLAIKPPFRPFRSLENILSNISLNLACSST